MSKARVFLSGNSQAVRIPKELQFDCDEVEIERRGDEIILRKPALNLAEAFHILAGLPDDGVGDGRQQPPIQERPGL